MKFIQKAFGFFNKENTDYQRALLKTVLITAAAAYALFTVVNLITFAAHQGVGNLGAVLNGITAVSFFAILQTYRQSKIDQKTASTLAVALFMLYMVVFFLISENRNFGFSWTPILPLLAYLLLDRKPATILSGLFCGAVLLFILLNQHAWLPVGFTVMSTLNIFGSTICLILGFNFYVASRKMASDSLETAKKQAEANKDELRLILDSTAEGIYGIDRNGACTFCNVRTLEILGYEREEELIGKNMHQLIHRTAADGTPVPASECRILASIAAGKKTHSEDEVFHRSDGITIPVEYLVIPKIENEVITGAVVTFHDITKRRRDEAQVLYLSSHDVLTGLHNRAYFEEWKTKYDCEENYPISVIFVDLNGLKLKNDVFGHAAGDENLKAVARALKRVNRKEDAIARIGGDEFVCLLPNTEPERVRGIMDSIREELADEASDGFSVGLSMGADTKFEAAQDINQVIKNAETEMYREKSLRRRKQDWTALQDMMENLYQKSPHNKQHALRTSELCEKMGVALGWPAAEVRKIRDAGFYHDIGKIALSDELLNAERELTLPEKTEKKQHVSIGYRVLSLFSNTLDLAETVYYHHENWDGSGYPKGLKAEEIPLPARIVAIAEQYDHIANPVRHTQPNREEAMSRIREKSGVKTDPALTEILMKLV